MSDSPTPAGDVKTAALVEAMTELGYRAANVGERDLVLGYDEFRSRTAGAGFEFVSANIVTKGAETPVFAPSTVLEVEGADGKKIRVGVTGVARFNPIFLKRGPGETNLVIRQPAKVLPDVVAELREVSDIVVLLAALHRDDAREIVQAVPGIDIVIGSYGGIYSTQEEREGDTWILYSGNQGKRLGDVRVFLERGAGGSSVSVKEVDPYLYFLSARYPSVDAMAVFVNDALKRSKNPGRAGATPGPGTATGASASSRGH